jgi:hypothetical protein
VVHGYDSLGVPDVPIFGLCYTIRFRIGRYGRRSGGHYGENPETAKLIATTFKATDLNGETLRRTWQVVNTDAVSFDTGDRTQGRRSSDLELHSCD